jgi:predicted PurR-regulated permease PerM
VIELADEIQDSITGYLLTVTTMNALVGVAVMAAVYVQGLGDPLLWGTVAFLLNFIPIIGPLTGIVIFLVAGLMTFDSFWWALLPASSYLAIHILEGEIVTPALLARRFTLNPVLVVMSIIVWHWIWGVLGALLAVPLLAMFKIVCDYVEPLKPLGHFIGASQNGGTADRQSDA